MVKRGGALDGRRLARLQDNGAEKRSWVREVVVVYFIGLNILKPLEWEPGVRPSRKEKEKKRIQVAQITRGAVQNHEVDRWKPRLVL